MTIVTVEEPTFANAVEKCVLEIQARYKAEVMVTKRLNQHLMYTISSDHVLPRVLNRAVSDLNALHNDKTFLLKTTNMWLFNIYYIQVDMIEDAPRTVDINITDDELECLYKYYFCRFYTYSVVMTVGIGIFIAFMCLLLSDAFFIRAIVDCCALLMCIFVAPRVLLLMIIEWFDTTPKSRRKGLNILLAFNE